MSIDISYATNPVALPTLNATEAPLISTSVNVPGAGKHLTVLWRVSAQMKDDQFTAVTEIPMNFALTVNGVREVVTATFTADGNGNGSGQLVCSTSTIANLSGPVSVVLSGYLDPRLNTQQIGDIAAQAAQMILAIW